MTHHPAIARVTFTPAPYYREGDELRERSSGNRVYRLEPIGRRGWWGRLAFTSGGWWRGDGEWPSYAEASRELDELRARLNAT